MSARGAYRQVAGRKVRRVYDAFYNFGAAVDAALRNQAARESERSGSDAVAPKTNNEESKSNEQ